MKFEKKAASLSLVEEVESIGEFEKKGRGTATYSAADAIERLRKKREETRKALEKQADDANKGIDNTDKDRTANHGIAHKVVESKRRAGSRLTEDVDVASWDALWGQLTESGDYEESALEVSPIYEEGIRVWAMTASDLAAAEDAARELGFREIKRTYDANTSGEKKWRVDINTANARED